MKCTAFRLIFSFLVYVALVDSRYTTSKRRLLAIRFSSGVWQPTMGFRQCQDITCSSEGLISGQCNADCWEAKARGCSNGLEDPNCLEDGVALIEAYDRKLMSYVVDLAITFVSLPVESQSTAISDISTDRQSILTLLQLIQPFMTFIPLIKLPAGLDPSTLFAAFGAAGDLDMRKVLSDVQGVLSGAKGAEDIDELIPGVDLVQVFRSIDWEGGLLQNLGINMKEVIPMISREEVGNIANGASQIIKNLDALLAVMRS